MKTEMVETLSPGAAGNYDITGTSPSSDMVGAIFMTAASTSHNNTPTMRWSIGATDLTNNIGCSMSGQDGNNPAGIRSMMSRSHCLFSANALGSNTAPVAAYSSTLTNGVRLALAAAPAPVANRLTETLLISGTDCQMQVGQQYFAAADTTHDIAHSFGAPPDVVIIMTSTNVPSSADEADGTGMSIGFWDRQSGNQSSVSFHATDLATPTDYGAYASNNSVAEILTVDGTNQRHLTLSGANNTKFTVALNAAASGNTQVGWIALRGLTNQMASLNQLFSLPTATGVTNLVNGMAGRPQCFLVIPTRMVTGNSFQRNDTGGSMGLSCGATNDYISNTQGGTACTFKFNVGPAVAKTTITNASCLLEVDNTGTINVQATVQNWNSDGVDLNYTNVGAAACQAIVLAFGLTAPSVTLAYPFSRTQFFVNDQVTYS